MTVPFTRFSLAPLALAAIVLAGCGNSSATKSATATPTTAALTPQTLPTQAIPPTPVITGGSVAALVNGHPIPMSQYQLLLNLATAQSASQPGATPKALASQTMNQVIIDELVREYAAKHGITVSPAEVAAQRQKDITALHGQAGFEAQLKKFGLTPASYTALVTPSLLGQKVENKIAPLGTAKMQPYATVRHILIMTKPTGKPARTDAQAHALAQQILTKVQHGGDFAKLAKQYSDDPGSGAQGGLLAQCCAPGQTVPPFDHAVFNQKLHVPTLVKSQFGYHIIEVQGRVQKPESTTTLQQAQRNAFLTWVNAQMKAAKITRLAKVKGA